MAKSVETKIKEWSEKNDKRIIDIHYYPDLNPCWRIACLIEGYHAGSGNTLEEAWADFLSVVPKPKRTRKKKEEAQDEPVVEEAEQEEAATAAA